MTAQHEFQQGLPHKSLGKCALQGAGIALVLMVIFLLFIGLVAGVWVPLPMITATAGGALGGIVYYLMVQVWYQSGWKKILATIVSILVYIVLFWFSLIVAFSITGHWD
jgi:hypothetical protein